MKNTLMNRHLGRRDLIKHLAAAGVLSSVSATKALAADESPVRVVIVALQHGWGLSGTSNRFLSNNNGVPVFPDGLDPLNSIKQHCTAIDGIMTLGEWGNNHDLSYADMLTAGVPYGQKQSDFDSHMPLSITPSLDHLLEESSGRAAFRFCAGYRTWGVKYHPLSFGKNSEVLPFFTTASDAYNSIFKDLPEVAVGAGNASPSGGDARMLASLFDYLKAPAEAKLEILGDEKVKLERYLSALEHVKSKNTAVVGYSGSERIENIPSSDQGRLDDVDSYLEMIKVGLANNITSTAILGIGDINAIPSFHHDHAHGNTGIFWNTRRTFAQKIVSFANELDQIIDFDGNTLLDNTLILLTGEVGDGRHNVVSKGQVIVGGRRHIAAEQYIKPERLVGDDLNRIRREDSRGALQKATRWSKEASSLTNADMLRDIGIIAGLDIDEFGLPSQNQGDLLV